MTAGKLQMWHFSYIFGFSDICLIIKHRYFLWQVVRFTNLLRLYKSHFWFARFIDPYILPSRIFYSSRLLTSVVHLIILNIMGLPDRYVQVCSGNYDICMFTRGPHSLDWNTAVKLVWRHEPANQSVKYKWLLNLNATDVSDSRACNVLTCLEFLFRKVLFSFYWTLQEHLGLLSVSAPHPYSLTVLPPI